METTSRSGTNRHPQTTRGTFSGRNSHPQTIKAVELMTSSASDYGISWTSSNAADHQEFGHYIEMSREISGFATVLEVGTGDGRGTLQMAREGHTVVSIDNNPVCLQLASDRLAEANLDFAADLTRCSISGVFDGENLIAFRKPNVSFLQSPLTLLHGWIGPFLPDSESLLDPTLVDWLGEFDAVTYWLPGSWVGFEISWIRLRYVMELSSRVLRSRGVLNIVERQQSGYATQPEIFGLYADLSGGTALRLESLRELGTEYDTTNHKVKLNDYDGNVVCSKRMNLVSSIYVKD